MVTPARGSIVLVPFPFSDLSQSKLRPAVVVSSAGSGDWILCQITSNAYADGNAVEVRDADMEKGSLNLTSYVRPGKLFSGSSGLMAREVARLKRASLDNIIGAVVKILQQ